MKNIFQKIKTWLEYHRFFQVEIKLPVVFKKKPQPGRVVIFKSRDIEIDRERKLKEEEAEKNLPHPVE